MSTAVKTFARQCSITGKPMNEGWVWCDGVFYTATLSDTLKELRRDRDTIVGLVEELTQSNAVDPTEWEETLEAIDRLKENEDTDSDLLQLAFQCDYLYHTEWDTEEHQYGIDDNGKIFKL